MAKNTAIQSIKAVIPLVSSPRPPHCINYNQGRNNEKKDGVRIFPSLL